MSRRVLCQKIGGGGFTYLTDTFTNLRFGFGLKKLSPSAVFGIRMKRPSDNAETDVYLYDDPMMSIDLNSEISAGGILGDWYDAGLNPHSCLKIYDQIGTNHITGSFYGIIFGGNLVTVAGNGVSIGIDTNTPYMRTSSTEVMTGIADSAFDDGNDFTIVGTGHMFSAAHTGNLFSTSTNVNRVQMYLDRSATKKGGKAQATTTALSVLDAGFNNATNNFRHQILVVKGSTKTIDFYRMGSLVDSGDAWTGTYNNDNFKVGYFDADSANNGGFIEIIGFNADKGSDAAAIYADFQARYA